VTVNIERPSDALGVGMAYHPGDGGILTILLIIPPPRIDDNPGCSFFRTVKGPKAY